MMGHTETAYEAAVARGDDIFSQETQTPLVRRFCPEDVDMGHGVIRLVFPTPWANYVVEPSAARDATIAAHRQYEWSWREDVMWGMTA